MASFSEIADQVYGKQTATTHQSPYNSNPDNNRKKKAKDELQDKERSKPKPQHTAFKYSRHGKECLQESILLSGRPSFLRYENSQFKTADKIDELGRLIKPPCEEQYPSAPYEFVDVQEIQEYADKEKKESKASLFLRAKSIVKKYNDQDEDLITLLGADIVWSYFQDRFSTTHYIGIVGDNGSGKSTVGDTLEAIGYRPINMTDPTAANLFRVLGSIEPGQCTIVADEAERIDQSLDIMNILKIGYHIRKKIARTNINTWSQEFFWTYSFKVIISERSFNRSTAKGILDRTFIFNTYRGNSEHDIKEVINPAGDKVRQQLLDELIDFRKLMLIHRLIHFNDPIPDISIGLDGRDKELCKPVIQLFFNTNVQKEIELALQRILATKNQQKSNTVEAALFPVIANLISQHGNEVTISEVWESIKDNIDGYWDERKPSEYHTSEFGTIYRNTITNIICDKFGAKRKHKETGNVLIFNPQKVARVGGAYNTKASIQTKLLQSPEDPEGSEGSIKLTVKSLENNENEITENRKKLNENIQDTIQNITNSLREKDDKKLGSSLEPSALSEPSDRSIVQDPREQERKETTIHRIGHTDTWGCQRCILKGDRHFMKVHICSKRKAKR